MHKLNPNIWNLVRKHVDNKTRIGVTRRIYNEATTKRKTSSLKAARTASDDILVKITKYQERKKALLAHIAMDDLRYNLIQALQPLIYNKQWNGVPRAYINHHILFFRDVIKVMANEGTYFHKNYAFHGFYKLSTILDLSSFKGWSKRVFVETFGITKSQAMALHSDVRFRKVMRIIIRIMMLYAKNVAFNELVEYERAVHLRYNKNNNNNMYNQ